MSWSLYVSAKVRPSLSLLVEFARPEGDDTADSVHVPDTGRIDVEDADGTYVNRMGFR